jgi:hypothetical protein
VQREQLDILDGLVDIQEPDLARRFCQERAAARAELRLGQSRSGEARQQSPDHDRAGIGGIGEILGPHRLAVADRKRGERVNCDGETRTRWHDRLRKCVGVIITLLRACQSALPTQFGHVITMTKQGKIQQLAWHLLPAVRRGTGAPDYEIKTTHHQLVDPIWEAVEECFADWRVSGPKPPETIVSRLVAEALERVSGRENRIR